MYFLPVQQNAQSLGSGYYLYRKTTPYLCCYGIIGRMEMSAYKQGFIKGHEEIKPPSVQEIVRKLTHSPTLVMDPVLITYEDSHNLSSWIRSFPDQAWQSSWHTTTEHHDWIPLGSADMTHDFAHMFTQHRSFYIADGHHRFKAAELVARGAQEATVLCNLVAEQDLSISPQHQWISGTHRHFWPLLRHQLERFFTVSLSAKTPPPDPGASVHIFFQGNWWTGHLKEALTQQLPSALHLSATLMERYIWQPFCESLSERECKHLHYTKMITPDIDAHFRLQAQTDPMGIGLKLNPITALQIRAIADAGWLMPPKSTWIEPKMPPSLLPQTPFLSTTCNPINAT